MPLDYRGRRECRVPAAPAASRAKLKKHTSVVTTGSDGFNRHPLHNGFNGLSRALPGERIRLVTVAHGLKAHRTRSGRLRLRELGTSNGRQDHTTWPSAKNPL